MDKFYHQLADQIQVVATKSGTLEINSDESFIRAAEMIAQVEGLIKELDAKRKKAIKTPDSYIRSVNSFVQGFQAKMEGTVKGLKAKIADYNYHLELKRRETESN